MALDSYLPSPDGNPRSLVVANRTEPEPLQRMIENLFAEQEVSVGERAVNSYDDDTVLLVEDGEILATSPLRDLQNAILMVNSDLYVTGTRHFAETDVPEVINGLAETPFRLRGYPESNSEKLLLILISRHIERLAYAAEDGTLRSSFQRLSRIRDESGTKETYQSVAGTGVDVHVYGRADWEPTRELDVTAHAGRKWDFENSWFVLYEPESSGPDSESAALLAIQSDDRTWDGFWTYDRSAVEELARYVRCRL